MVEDEDVDSVRLLPLLVVVHETNEQMDDCADLYQQNFIPHCCSIELPLLLPVRALIGSLENLAHG